MLMDIIKERHSIRKYTDEQISLKELIAPLTGEQEKKGN